MAGGDRVYSCREAEKMVMPYINHQLDETQLEQFLKHVRSCPACREELEIYYTVSVGLKQLDEGTGVYDIPGLLEESMENAWLTVRTARLRKVICYAANTLNAASVLVILLMQLRIWIQR